MKSIRFFIKAGRKGHNAARNDHVPLVSLPCIYSRFSWLHVPPHGFITPVIEYLRMTKNSPSWTPRKKLTHIVFDEMKIKNEGDIDRILDCVVGPAKDAHFVMARGIADCWKWEVWLAFDHQITSPDIISIIVGLEVDAGLHVVSVSCDQGGKNVGLNKSFKITTENWTFPHPLDSERSVHFFHDFGHEFKNLRNHMMDDAMTLPCGTKITKRDFTDLQRVCEDEITCGFHIEDILLDCVSSDRQQTRYAIRQGRLKKWTAHFT